MKTRALRLAGALMSLNDPQWGKRPGREGPPDLDELWRNFNRKLDGLFGRRGGGGDGERPPSAGRRFGGAGLLALLIVAVWLVSGFYIVYEGQRGVVLQFGKFKEITMPGPRWHLPYPIETAEVVNVAGVRTVEVGYRNNVKSKVLKESLMLTDDENIVDVQFAVQYVLKSPTDYLFNSRVPDDAVLQAAETAVREIVGKSSMDFVIFEGRAEVAARARKLMQEILDRYGTGISISNVTMQNAQPPEQVQASFDDAVKAGQDRERQKN
ncbi:MAG: HflK protein, partial [Burkholderiales bacterium]|nr:HflK protein [Burkholderiales bacterium]